MISWLFLISINVFFIVIGISALRANDGGDLTSGWNLLVFIGCLIIDFLITGTFLIAKLF